MGLLDNFVGNLLPDNVGPYALSDADKRKLKKQGLLTAGLTLLGTPSAGGGIARGLLAGVNAIQDGGDKRFNDMYRGDLMNRTAEGAKRNTAIEAASQGVVNPDGTINQPKFAELMALDPERALKLQGATNRGSQRPIVRRFIEGNDYVERQYDPASGRWNEAQLGGAPQAPMQDDDAPPMPMDRGSAMSAVQQAEQEQGFPFPPDVRLQMIDGMVRGGGFDTASPSLPEPVFSKTIRSSHTGRGGAVSGQSRIGATGRGPRFKDAPATSESSGFEVVPKESLGLYGLPPGTVAQRDKRTGKLQILSRPDTANGRGGQAPIKPTEDQSKASGWYQSSAFALQNLRSALKEDPEALYPGAVETYGGLREVKQRSMTPTRQRAAQAFQTMKMDFLHAATGAGFSAPEAEDEWNNLAPQRGDSKELAEQKLAQIEVKLNAMGQRAGPALPLSTAPTAADADARLPRLDGGPKVIRYDANGKRL